jgi:tetratricopeptide (TPR) repeat protein
MRLPELILLLCLPACFARVTSIEHARNLIREGHVATALREIAELKEEAANDPDLQFKIGELLQELAASRAERLQSLAPDSAEAHELVGKSLESHQKLEEALAEYKAAAKQAPNLPGVHFLIANVYSKLQNLSAAKTALDAELTLNPNHALACLRMGQIFLITDANSPDKALPYLRKAAAGGQAGLESHRELGKALRMAGRYEEALKELQFVAQRRPNDEMIHAQLAAVYRAMGNAQASRAELETHARILRKKHEAVVSVRQAK